MRRNSGLFTDAHGHAHIDAYGYIDAYAHIDAYGYTDAHPTRLG
ncbi:MAG: hypothetical protein ABSA52_09560 [Candidatus Binatia bacterium]